MKTSHIEKESTDDFVTKAGNVDLPQTSSDLASRRWLLIGLIEIRNSRNLAAFEPLKCYESTFN